MDSWCLLLTLFSFYFFCFQRLIGAIYYPLSHSFGIPEEHITILADALKQITIEGVNVTKISEFQQELYIIGYIDQIKEIVSGEAVQTSIEKIQNISENMMFCISGILIKNQ